MPRASGAWRGLVAASAVAAAALLSACHRSGGVENAATDRGAYRNAPLTPVPEASPHALPNGTKILATPAAAELDRYLASDAPPGRAFDLPSVSFAKGMEVREDPNGAVAALVAVLRQHPSAHIRIEVSEASPGMASANPSARDRAAVVARLFQQNGLPASRFSIAGRKAGPSDRPRPRLVVTAK